MTAGPKGDTGSQGPAGLDANVSTMYPTTSVYITTNSTATPSTLLGFGTWSRVMNISASTVYGNISPFMTSNTAPSGNTTKCDTSYSGTYDCFKAFDGYATTTMWASVKAGYPHWVSIQVPSNHTVKKYTISPRNDIPLDTPKNWTLNASTNGNTWTTIDSQSLISWSAYTPQTFSLSNNNPYTYYCVTVTATGQNDVVAIGEITLYEIVSEIKSHYYWERIA